MAKPTITEVGRVTVPSADQDRSLAFYTETLGFETRIEVQHMGAPVPPMFAVRDPEGNELTIVEPLED